jgi:SAM-dependent methyltransferase
MFKQYVHAEIAAGLDETYRFEGWAERTPGAAYYDVHVAVIDERETCVPILREVLGAPGRRVLESGCGSGRWMAWFERQGHRAVGVDDSPGPLAAARAHDGGLRLVRGDAEVSPFATGSFDVVFSAYVAEHFPAGPDVVLREMHRVLRPGGALVLIVPCQSWFRRLVMQPALRVYYALARLRGRPLAFTEHRFTRAEIAAAVTRAGFSVDRIAPDDYRYPWAKGLCVDLGGWVRPAHLPPGSWELNGPGRLLARALNALSPWAACAGVLVVGRKAGG